MKLHQLASIGVGLLLALCASDAFAAGFYVPGHGVKPNGRAGAFVASGGQNLNSLWHNPANLAGMEELQLTVDLSLINISFDFQREDRVMENGDVMTYD